MKLSRDISYSCMPRHRLESGHFSLVAVQPNHIELIRQWRNDQMDVLRQVSVITLEQQKDYYSTHVWPEVTNSQPKNILLTFLDGDKPIGYGGIVHIAWEHRRAEVSFLLDPLLNKTNDIYADYFSTFLDLLFTLAFDDLGLNRLFTETYVMRKHHISVLEDSGFLREGVLKHHIRINDQPVDSVIHGITSFNTINNNLS